MAATYTYFYTVHTFLNWNDVLTDNTGWTAIGIEGPNSSKFPDIIVINPESATSTSKVNWTTRKGNQLQYRVRFYLTVAGDTTTPSNNGTYWLKDDIVKHVTPVTDKASKLKIGKTNTDHNTFKPLPTVSPLKNNDGDTFWFTIEATQSDFKLTDLHITADIVNNNTVGGDPSNATKHATLHGIIPDITISAAKKLPPEPSIFTDYVLGEGAAANDKRVVRSGIGAPRTYDFCTKKWIGYNISGIEVDPKKPGSYKYTFAKVTCDTNGTNLDVGPRVPENKPNGLSNINGPEGPKLIAARKEIAAAIISNCTGVGSSGSGTRDKYVPAVPMQEPSADLRWNPPTHFASRGLPFGVYMDMGGDK